MTDQASGTGAAHNPTVITVDNAIPEPADTVQTRLIAEADRAIAGAEAKIIKVTAHLEGAKQGLARHISERKALG